MLNLFLTFFKIGLFTFGGGYAMIPLIQEELTDFAIDSYTFTDFIAIAESTPGPFAINIATFIGYSYNGILGAMLATFAVTLPSFLIITAIAIFFSKIQKLKLFKTFIKTTTPIVLGLILSSLIKISASTLFNVSSIATIKTDFHLNYVTLISFLCLTIISLTFFKIKKKKLSPFIIILLSLIFGIVAYLLSFFIQ